MEYRHKKTGFSFFSDCKIYGPDWEEVGLTNQPPKSDEVPVIEAVTEDLPNEETKEVIDEETDGVDGVTKKEIMQELDSMGIKFDPRTKKQELYNLMMSQGK